MDINKIHDTLIDYMNKDDAKKILDMIRPEKIWIATAVDYGESCDGKARVLGAFKSEAEAKAYVHDDIEEWVDNNPNVDARCDFDKMKTWLAFNESICCEWNVEAVEVKLTNF